jgi:hypothetical protein
VAGDHTPGGRPTDAAYDVQFFDKRPGGDRRTPPHQDGGYSDLTHVLAPVRDRAAPQQSWGSVWPPCGPRTTLFTRAARARSFGPAGGTFSPNSDKF